MATIDRINNLGKCTFNPRGNLWLKDESKFGQKLLTKMGWQRGKGLGRNEDGITETIKVKFKGSNTGIGWKDKSFLGAQNEEFDAVLENLNKNYLSNGKELSKDSEMHLVQRCQKFQERLHYRRFVKGKDISKYSEKEMKGIFIGMKSQVEEQEPLCEKSSISNLQNATVEDNSSNLSTTYNSSSSIADYFAQKMEEKASSLFSSASINSKGLNSNSTWLSNEIQEPNEPIQELSPNDIIFKNEKRKKSSKNSKSKKLKLEKVSDFKSCLKRVTSGNKILGKIKKNVSFSNLISYQEVPLVYNENSVISDDETVEFQNLDNKNNVNEQIFSKTSSIQNFKHGEENKKFEFNEIYNNNHCVNSENDIVLNKSDQSSIDITSEKVEIERTSDDSDHAHIAEAKKHTCGPVISEAQYSDCIQSILLNTTQEQSELMPESLSNGTIFTGKKRKKSSKNSKSKKLKLDTVSEFMSCLESVTNNKFPEKLKKNAFLNNCISCQGISLVSSDDGKVSVGAVVRLKDTDNKNGTSKQNSKNFNLLDCRFSKKNKETEFVKTNVSNHCNNLENQVGLNENDHSGDDSSKKEVECEKASEVLNDLGNTYSENVKRKANGTSNYNSWLESQRIAMKMNIYKSMIEKIKNHRVLSTTNLLQIKGYGNWGF